MNALHRLLPGILEGALVLIGLLISGGLLYLVGGHLMGLVKRQTRRGRPAPAQGAVPNDRHQNVTSVSVR